MFQFSATDIILMMMLFYGMTFLLTLRIGKKHENVDGFMVSIMVQLALAYRPPA